MCACSSRAMKPPSAVLQQYRILLTQTIPKWYEWVCDESKMCKMLGNGWTVDVIRHIFKFLKS